MYCEQDAPELALLLAARSLAFLINALAPDQYAFLSLAFTPSSTEWRLVTA